MRSKISQILRGATSCALFAAFGLGALVLSPVVIALGSLERRHALVRWSWKLLVWLFVRTGLICIDNENLPDVRGTILVANHPSLIDVVLLTVLIPRTLSVAKRSVRKNPFLSVLSRAISLPVGADNLPVLASYLDKGWNVLVFPEGTRSPFVGTVPTPCVGTGPDILGTGPDDIDKNNRNFDILHPFRRGAAQLALRTGAPVACIGISLTRRILAKRQAIWDMGTGPVRYRFRAHMPTVDQTRPGESLHAAAVRVTETLEKRVRELL